MDCQHVLITGGAGFVGSSLGVFLRRTCPNIRVTALDNLKRRGSELVLSRLRSAGVGFVHGDIRCPEDLSAIGDFDLMLECSAEPSVHAGATGSPRYVLQTNMLGTWNCLELARERKADVLFLSTSRVFPIKAINALPHREEATRFCWQAWCDDSPRGFSVEGIREDFPLEGPRSFYGASKLASELIVQEYAFNYGIKAIINRCGLIAGPWQMGKVDQGVIALWVARHYYQSPLKYIGFGGDGKQVRDVLHVDDLSELIREQIAQRSAWTGQVFNVGGGAANSVSLRELTDICREVSGRRVDVASCPDTNRLDVRIYQTDTRSVRRQFDWAPRRNPTQVVAETFEWLNETGPALKGILD